MSDRQAICLVFAIAISHFLAIFLCDTLFRTIDEAPYAAVFYYPAHTVSMIALLIGGYWAALGIVLGSFFWNFFFTHLSFSSSIVFFIFGWIYYVGIYWAYVSFYKPILRTEWQAITLQDFLVFALLFSGIFAVVNEFIFFEIPEIDPLTASHVILLWIKNFFICSLTFILLNLAMTFYVTLLKRFNIP